MELIKMEFKPEDQVIVLPRDNFRDSRFAKILWAYSKQQWVVEFAAHTLGIKLAIVNENGMIHARDADNETVFVILPEMDIYCKE
jgi:hypothetical protein